MAIVNSNTDNGLSVSRMKSISFVDAIVSISVQILIQTNRDFVYIQVLWLIQDVTEQNGNWWSKKYREWNWYSFKSKKFHITEMHLYTFEYSWVREHNVLFWSRWESCIYYFWWSRTSKTKFWNLKRLCIDRLDK